MDKMRILLTVFLLLILVGCKEKSDHRHVADAPPTVPPPATQPAAMNADQVRATVLRYNHLLAEGYRNLNMTPLEEVATRNEAEKAYTHMAALGEGTVRMVSQLKNIEFQEVSLLPPNKAQVRTREVWDFAYTDVKTGVKREEAKNFVYLVMYKLEIREGRWIIIDVAANSEGPPQPSPGQGNDYRVAPKATR